MYFVGKPGMYNPGISRFSLFSVQSLLFSVLGEVSGDAPLYLNSNTPGPVGFPLLKNSFGKGFSGGDVALRKKVNWSRHHSFWKKKQYKVLRQIFTSEKECQRNWRIWAAHVWYLAFPLCLCWAWRKCYSPACDHRCQLSKGTVLNLL